MAPDGPVVARLTEAAGGETGAEAAGVEAGGVQTAGVEAAGVEAAGEAADGRSDPRATAWSAAYVRAREREGRLYSDQMVARLPDVPRSDPLADEWRLRADSAKRLMAHLGRLPRPVAVLDVGCGNGWLTSRLAEIPDSRVVGLDANDVELAQAQRVFGGRPNLRFVLGDVAVAPPPIEDPTVIVLASVAQYVRDLPALIRRLRSWLAPAGELHILDSPFYLSAEVGRARERTRRYYAELGVPEMAGVYQHHDRGILEGFGPEIFYRPDSIRARAERRLLGRTRSPFPWILIRAEAAPSH